MRGAVHLLPAQCVMEIQVPVEKARARSSWPRRSLRGPIEKNSLTTEEVTTLSNDQIKEVLAEMSGDEALAIVRTLAEEDSAIAERIVQIFYENLLNEEGGEVEGVAADVFDELESLEVGELWDKSGSTRHGYVDPYEYSWEMIEERLAPFWEEMRRYQKLGLPAKAKNHCLGIMLGLYRFERDGKNEFKDWAADASEEYIDRTFSKWKESQPKPEDIAEVKAIIRSGFAQWEK